MIFFRERIVRDCVEKVSRKRNISQCRKVRDYVCVASVSLVKANPVPKVSASGTPRTLKLVLLIAKLTKTIGQRSDIF